jgi:hypothetical protein
MGLGPFKNGRYWPISPYKGSWAWQEAQNRQARLEGRPLPFPYPELPLLPAERAVTVRVIMPDERA